MESLRDIRRNIKSIEATGKIMYTMKMVASARIKKAQNAILSSRPFAVKMEQMVSSLEYELLEDLQDRELSWVKSVFQTSTSGTVCLLLITSDKGMCGAFNANLIRAAVDWISAHKNKKIIFFAVGKKGRDFIHRIKNLDIETVSETTGIFPNVTYAHAELLGKAMIDVYQKHSPEKFTVIYNEFKSLMSQKVHTHDFLPLLPCIKANMPECGSKSDFIFEPDQKQFFNVLIPRYVKAQLFRMLLESQAAELAARMNAMDSASNNARDIIDELTLKLNRTRQASITTELSEIVNGAEALKS